MHRLIILLASLMLVFFISSGNAVAQTAQSPLKVIENAYNELLSVLNDPAYQGKEAETKRQEKLKELANRIFDFRKVSLLALGRNARKFKKDEFDQFATLFAKLLQNTYVSRIDTYKDAKVSFDKERMLTPKKALVETTVTYQGKKIPITYRLYKNGNEWKGYDVLVEGISLLKNYRTQFNELLKKDTPAEVIKMVQAKLDEQAKLDTSSQEG